MSSYIVVSECAIKHNDKYLIITRPEGVHAGGMISLPGGKVDYDDAQVGHDILMTGIKREVFEELGLNLVDPLTYVTSSCFDDTVTGNKVLDVIFLCEINKTTLDIKPSPREVADYQWMTFAEVQNHPKTSPWLIEYIKKSTSNI